MTRPDPSRILDLASAFYDSCVLFTASDLDIFRALSELESADAERLAFDLDCNPRAMRLLLDGCVAIGLLDKHGETYSNTPESEAFLVSGNPGDLSRAIRYNRDVYDAWGKLPQLVRTGEPVEAPSIHLGDDKDRTRTFVHSMHARCLAIGRAVMPAIDLSDRTRLLDIGGGPGTYSVLAAQANPQLRCTVLDLPAVAAIAAELIAETDVADRVETLPGSYHDTPFPSCDVAHFFGVLHQESPESICALFRRAFDALEPGGTIHVMDMMTDESRTAPKFSALFAVNMALTTHNGWVFSDHDAEAWLAEAGFEEIETTPLPAPMPHWLTTAKKPL
ncbi:MAG: methyltransferase domain-containing protein [Phycisphaerales bacterium]|jgi:ubiquinone/menaquinone biosynthesis C-methylase UbiE|nr:methyltransferase domain-containing protein [Phycisphaerales bacterium]MBT7171889.1 methyltransferase domain-containing protein [Phycisphaerales bacterium]